MKPALLLLSAAGFLHAADITVAVDKSIILEQPTTIKRISITNASIAEAAAASSTEVLLNGKASGDTTLMIWDTKGGRSQYDVHVYPSALQIETVKGELAKELGPDVTLTTEGKSVFLRGLVPDQIAADRAVAIAGTLGSVINLLHVAVPAADPQILLKVRFANVNRNLSQQLGTNLAVAGQSGHFGGSLSNAAAANNSAGISDVLSVLTSAGHVNVGAAIQALQAKSLLEILAEPNLLTVSGRPASFLAGGEFPFPTIQGGAAGIGQITVQFKEFGIRLNFLPSVTPRGTIRMTVGPEVSSLDYSNGLVVNGYTVPALSTRRVQTEVELESGQSFIIAGLLNNQVQEQLNKIPGLGDVPLLGKLFQSRTQSKSNTELLVLVTPELVRPLPNGAAPPSIPMPRAFIKESAIVAPQHPGEKTNGPVPQLPVLENLPVELFRSVDPAASLPPVPKVAAPTTPNPAAVTAPPGVSSPMPPR